MEEEKDTPSQAVCSNCGATLQGGFCHHCGQKAEAPDTLLGFLKESIGDLFDFRSRTLRSIVHLVTRPGELTKSYFTGKRVLYTQPLQIYLICAAVFFLANSFRPFVKITEDNSVESYLSTMRTGQTLSAEQLKNLSDNGIPIEVFRERFRGTLSQSLPQFMVGSILLFALALWLFHPRRPALLHLIFSVHWTGLFLFIMVFERLSPFKGIPGAVVNGLIALVPLIHLILSVRKAYGDSLVRGILGGFGLYIVFNIILVLWVIGVVEFAYRQAF